MLVLKPIFTPRIQASTIPELSNHKGFEYNKHFKGKNWSRKEVSKEYNGKEQGLHQDSNFFSIKTKASSGYGGSNAFNSHVVSATHQDTWLALTFCKEYQINPDLLLGSINFGDLSMLICGRIGEEIYEEKLGNTVTKM